MLLASLVAAVLAVITAPVSFAAEATISWSGTLTVKDTYTHTYSKQATDGDPQSCDGSLVTELSATYRLSPRTATVQADARVWGSYVPIEVTSQSGHTKGWLTCTSNNGSSESTVDGPLQFQAAEPLESLLEYDREVDRLAFVHGAGPATYITAPPVKHSYTNGNESGTNAGHYEPPFRAAGPRLEFEPRFGQPLSDYRIPFPRSTAASSNLDVTHQNPLSHSVDGGNAASASNGLPLGNYSNFGGLVGSPISNIALHEEITADLHGVVANAAPWSESEVPVMAVLGDSFTSGEGAYAYAGGTDVPGVNHCHRSGFSYGLTAYRAMRDDPARPLAEFHSFACSGAKSTHLLTESFCGSGCEFGQWERAQIVELAELEHRPGTEVDLVTIGIGGNDAAFADVIKGCLFGSNCIAKFEPRADGELPGHSIPQVAASVRGLLAKVTEVSPNADIVLVGYPVFISEQYSECPHFGREGIGADEAEWIRGQVLEMNRALASAAADYAPAARFLSLDEAYGDNVLCNGGEHDSQWVHSLVVRGLEQDRTPSGHCTVYKGSAGAGVCNESFHPKAEGHAAAAEALRACVQDWLCGQASPQTVREPAEILGPIRCKAGPCLLMPGEPVPVHATGFRPGTTVEVALHSRPVKLSEALVAADGSVDIEVTVPPGAAVPGQHRLVITGPGDSTIVRVASTEVEVSCSTGFSDVGPEHPFCSDVTWVTSTGVTSGYPDGTYRPAVGLSRAQMASFLWRLAGQPPASPDAPAFTDVVADDTHHQAIRWLAGRRITTGYGDGTFRPNEGLSRQHMAAFLHRYAGQPAPAAGAPAFHDVSADSAFATAISWLAGEGITVGKGDGSFGPADKLTRQQMAAFLRRFGEPRGLPS